MAEKRKEGTDLASKLEPLNVQERCDYVYKHYGVHISLHNMRKVYEMRALRNKKEFAISKEDQIIVQREVKLLL